MPTPAPPHAAIAPLPQPRVAVDLVDTDVHPTPQSDEELRAYLPEPWRSRPHQTFAKEQRVYDPWGGGYRNDAVPEGGPPGSDPAFTESQLFDEAMVDIAMLLPMVQPRENLHAEAALTSAMNAWLADTWLDAYNGHGRYRGAISVAPDMPSHAVQEIERWGEHPYYSQVRINNYIDGLFGEPRYHPVYEAATKHNLPMCVHFGKTSGVSLATPTGFASTYFEIHSLVSLNYASHLTSLIMQGVFEKYPTLKFVFVEGGFSWVLPLLWRMDKAWCHLADEVPWLRRKPSDYVRTNVRFTSQPIEEPDQLRDLFRTYDLIGASDLLMFSSDYPHWDYDSPVQATFRRLPKSMRRNVMHQTATDLYQLPADRVLTPPARVHPSDRRRASASAVQAFDPAD